MLTLIKDDPNLKTVLKELSDPGRRFGGGGARRDRGPHAGCRGAKNISLSIENFSAPLGRRAQRRQSPPAQDQGLDMARLEQDVASEEVGATLSEDVKLAGAMRTNGTPGYVVGDKVVLGAVGMAALKERIHAARGHSAS